MTPFYRLVAAVSLPVLKLAYRLDAKGLEHLPQKGGYVLAANHTSSFDPWPLGLPLFPHRHLRFMGKSELFNPVLAPLLRAGGAFPVRRGERDFEAIETAVRLCKEGEVVAMFPQGTRQVKGLRKKHEFRPRTGSARIALAARVPLVPAAIKGTDRLRSLARLSVAYGEPVPLDDLEGLELREAAEIGTDRLMERIEALYSTL